jgi:RNA polymerase sigma-70 factor (ECF subfamily)
MAEPASIADCIRRIRAGDEQAAAELVKRYEPLIRREVRFQLQDRRLARTFDSMDICQSVLCSFFVRVAVGQYELERPEQLLRLLMTMARNKLASQARRQYRLRRDTRRTAGRREALEAVASDEPSPSRVLCGRELLEQFRKQLNDDERAVAELRADGLSWAEIAERLGGKPQARRMQLTRAVDRASRALGLDEVEDE